MNYGSLYCGIRTALTGFRKESPMQQEAGNSDFVVVLAWNGRLGRSIRISDVLDDWWDSRRGSVESVPVREEIGYRDAGVFLSKSRPKRGAMGTFGGLDLIDTVDRVR